MARYLVVLALAACSDHRMSVAELRQLNVIAEFLGNPTERLGSARFEQPGAPASSCVLLADDITATVDGVRVSDQERGDTSVDESGHEGCSSAIIGVSVDVAPTAPDAISDVELRDSTGDVHATIIAPYATRSVAVDGGRLVPGQTATLHWQLATDTLAPADQAPAPGIQIACYAPGPKGRWGDQILVASSGSRADHPDWVPLALSGLVLSFPVPSLAYRGPLACVVNAAVEAGFAACDFASCRTEFVAFSPDLPPLSVWSSLPFATSI